MENLSRWPLYIGHSFLDCKIDLVMFLHSSIWRNISYSIPFSWLVTMRYLAEIVPLLSYEEKNITSRGNVSCFPCSHMQLPTDQTFHFYCDCWLVDIQVDWIAGSGAVTRNFTLYASDWNFANQRHGVPSLVVSSINGCGSVSLTQNIPV